MDHEGVWSHRIQRPVIFRLRQCDSRGTNMHSVPVKLARVNSSKVAVLRRCLNEGDEVEIYGVLTRAGAFMLHSFFNASTQTLVSVSGLSWPGCLRVALFAAGLFLGATLLVSTFGLLVHNPTHEILLTTQFASLFIAEAIAFALLLTLFLRR